MRRIVALILGLLLCLNICQTGSAFAGQVVTEELRQWAQDAIANEKALSESPPSTSVAVLYYRNKTGNSYFNPLKKGLAVMLAIDLAKVKDLQVVERARLQAILEEMELGKTGLADTKTAPRIGRLVGARFLSGGDILQGSLTPLEVDPNLTDVSEETVVNQATAVGDVADLITIEKEILLEIVRLMEITLTSDEKTDLEKPISLSIPALLLLFKGVDAGDHGYYNEAAKLYKQALAKDPELIPAKEALEEINTLGLTSKEAAPKTTDTVKAKQPATSAEPEVTAAKSGGGFSKYTAIGLGIAAAGAGVIYLVTSDDDDDNENTTSPPTTEPPSAEPAVTSTTPASGQTGVSDSLREIRVEFNKSMNRNAGQIVTQSSEWQVPGAATIDWQNDQVMFIRRLDNNPLPEGDVGISLRGFQDSDGLNMDTYNFSFSVYSDSPPPPTPPPPGDDTEKDIVPPTVVQAVPSFISCSSSTIEITFSETIDLIRGYQVIPSPGSWNISNISWKGENSNSVLVIYSENDAENCCLWKVQDNNNISELVLTFKNFYDLAGNPLGEQHIAQIFPINRWPDNCID